MTPILFYGVPSGCSFGSIVALEWLRQPYHLCRIDMPGQVQGEDYRRLNPLGETPTLRTAQGELLSESLAILNHLAAKGIAQGLGFAQGTSGFDRLNHRLAYLNTSFFGAYAPLWHALEHAEGDDGEALRAYGTTKVRHAHQALEQMIGTGPWLLGEQRSFADAYFAGIARWNDYHQVVDRREFPGCSSCSSACRTTPACSSPTPSKRSSRQPAAVASSARCGWKTCLRPQRPEPCPARAAAARNASCAPRYSGMSPAAGIRACPRSPIRRRWPAMPKRRCARCPASSRCSR
jgi:glutathione S-transferase